MSGESPVQVPRPVPIDQLALAPSPRDGRPVRPPADVGAFRFAVVSALRAGQLLRGCVPRVDGGAHRATVIAQLEVAGGKIAEVGINAPAPVPDESPDE